MAAASRPQQHQYSLAACSQPATSRPLLPSAPDPRAHCHGEVRNRQALKGGLAPRVLPAALLILEVLLRGLLPQYTRQLVPAEEVRGREKGPWSLGMPALGHEGDGWELRRGERCFPGGGRRAAWTP